MTFALIYEDNTELNGLPTLFSVDRWQDTTHEIYNLRFSNGKSAYVYYDENVDCVRVGSNTCYINFSLSELCIYHGMHLLKHHIQDLKKDYYLKTWRKFMFSTQGRNANGEHYDPWIIV